VHFGLALPTGAESLGEYLDVDLVATTSEIDLDELPARLNPALPVGIEATAAREIDSATTSLQEAVTSCTWNLVVTGGTVAELQAAVDRVTAADELVVTRQRKGRDVIDDVAPYLIDVAVIGQKEGGVEIVAELGTRPRGLRPSELVALLGDPFREARICRTHQWMQPDGARQEPLPELATSAPHARTRAS
jgi:radical SAM-linked protein